ncbi:acyl-CoA dehydrogenase family protein [Nocardioides sp.]|uniref:acyl-CoA dehydrogenase family protein n=1 Tax=Nocardioides sp. TaxID=35761 RepID=UPI0039E2F600
MDFELSEEQAMLRDVSRSMLASSCPAELVREIAAAEGDLDEKLWRLASEIGWPGLAVPEEYDGAGQGITELALVAEELGRAAAPGPFVETALTAATLARSAGVSLPIDGLLDGSLKATLAHHGAATLTEAGADLVLSGRLRAVQAAAGADWLLVTASRAGGGRALAVVEAHRTTRTRRRTLDQTRGWYDVELDDLRLPAGHLVSADAAEIDRLVDAATVLTAADALGVGERLLEMSVDYVKVREQFDRPLGTFQSVKHKVSDMLTTLKGARAAVYHAAMSLDAGVRTAPLATSVAKAFTGGISRLAGEALQTHGGIGFTWEHDLHLYLRRAKVDEVLFGAPSEHHERIVALLE